MQPLPRAFTLTVAATSICSMCLVRRNAGEGKKKEVEEDDLTTAFYTETRSILASWSWSSFSLLFR